LRDLVCDCLREFIYATSLSCLQSYARSQARFCKSLTMRGEPVAQLVEQRPFKPTSGLFDFWLIFSESAVKPSR
jgi:hypothetical protein